MKKRIKKLNKFVKLHNLTIQTTDKLDGTIEARVSIDHYDGGVIIWGLGWTKIAALDNLAINMKTYLYEVL